MAEHDSYPRSDAAQAQHWHTVTAAEAAERLRTDVASGLAHDEAQRRLADTGPNEIPEGARRRPLAIALAQFTDVTIVVLLAAGVVAGFLGEAGDAIAILAIVALNGIIGFVQEWRAERALAALRGLAAPMARVRRGDREHDVPARELVPGDVVLLEAGRAVPADLRLVEAQRLRAHEAALTGENEPVDKGTERIADSTAAIGDRRNLAFKGTHVTAGRGTGIVTGTGLGTELGAIARMLYDQGPQATPLQRRLAGLGRRLALAVGVVCAVIFAAGLLRGEPPLLMFMTAVSLAVAAIPEALPAVVSISLALGARRMAARRALARRLPAVEALGSVTCICTDKTGTLTENRMRVAALYVGDERLEPAAVPRAQWELLGPALALCSDAGVDAASGELRGDPTETALYSAAAAAGFAKETLAAQHRRIAEIPFSAESKRMATVHEWPAEDGSSHRVFGKGAPEAVLPLCVAQHGGEALLPIDPERLLAAAGELAADGCRVLAVATRALAQAEVAAESGAAVDPADAAAIECDLVLLGLVALQDPPRAGARDAVVTCRTAGIRTLMITGDHPATAAAIARDVGILGEDARVVTGHELAGLAPGALDDVLGDVGVCARVSPAQKLDIVQSLQRRGEIVAMTGDGVNDAPALRRADIGVAMGRGGTDVARESADLVLLDDEFATIVRAVHEGRRIYDDIRKFVRFSMAGNSAEVATLFLAPFLGLPLPLVPIQILWINLVTDGLPGLALAAEPAERDAMRRPPRPPGESIFARGLGVHVLWVGALMAVLALALQAHTVPAGAAAWQTMVFTTLTLAQMAHLLAVRSETESLFAQGLASNLPLAGAVASTVALQLAVVYVPALNGIFHTVALGPAQLGLCALAAVVVFVAVEIEKLVRRRTAR